MKIKLEKRYKYAGDIYKLLVEKAEYPIEVAADLLNGIKDADVVEVVRCKDCKNVKMLIDIIGEPHLFCCSGRSINRMRVEFDDYCSYGERREE